MTAQPGHHYAVSYTWVHKYGGGYVCYGSYGHHIKRFLRAVLLRPSAEVLRSGRYDRGMLVRQICGRTIIYLRPLPQEL